MDPERNRRPGKDLETLWPTVCPGTAEGKCNLPCQTGTSRSKKKRPCKKSRHEAPSAAEAGKTAAQHTDAGLDITASCGGGKIQREKDRKENGHKSVKGSATQAGALAGPLQMPQDLDREKRRDTKPPGQQAPSGTRRPTLKKIGWGGISLPGRRGQRQNHSWSRPDKNRSRRYTNRHQSWGGGC